MRWFDLVGTWVGLIFAGTGAGLPCAMSRASMYVSSNHGLQMLTREEFASLLIVGNTSAGVDPPAAIPAEHRAKLIVLGYMVDLDGRLRMTTPGRQRIREGIEKQAVD
jgi:hypothetical protein